jgi:hypothetical protein
MDGRDPDEVSGEMAKYVKAMSIGERPSVGSTRSPMRDARSRALTCNGHSYLQRLRQHVETPASHGIIYIINAMPSARTGGFGLARMAMSDQS